MEQETQEQQRNPWISIWFSPRSTARFILQEEFPVWMLILLAAIGNVYNAFTYVPAETLSLAMILLAAFAGGVLLAPVSLYLGAFLLWWTGTWLNGKATVKDLVKISAWSSVPAIGALAALLFRLGVAGKQILLDGELILPALRESLVNALWIVEVVFVVWILVFYLKGVSEAQQFSVWKAVWNTIFAVLLVAIVVLAGYMIASPFMSEI